MKRGAAAVGRLKAKLTPFNYRLCRWPIAALLIVATVSLSVSAEPWLEVGDRALRNDVETLASRGLIDGPVSTWPLPAGQLIGLTDDARLADQPEYVQLAAHRVLQRLLSQGQPAGLRPQADWRMTNQPDVVRAFGTSARDELDTRAGLVWDGEQLSAALHVGEQSHFNGEHGSPALDGSYVSRLLYSEWWGDWQLYGGWVDQWYGPGWTSSLLLSNNARPFPKIGIMRNSARASSSRWFRWLGPWQLNFFVGMLDGPRIDRNTAFGSLRLVFTPFRHFEVGLARITEFCGVHHSCSPLKAAFQVSNSSQSANSTNDESGIDFKYSSTFGDISLSPYLQLMNEDTGPFTHADTSYLGGLSFAGPWGTHGAQWRTTVEYADTVPTLNMFEFGKVSHGVAYNDGQYVDGMRYRGRTLGFSLDSDSRLLTVSGSFIDLRGWAYRTVFYHADISSSQLAAIQQQGAGTAGTAFNSVSPTPVTLNEAEIGLSIPLRIFAIDLSLRTQDSKATPDQNGKVAGEVDISYRF